LRFSEKFKKNNGSVTVEAAVALPAFMFAILGMAILMRVVFTYGTIQHAINETSATLSTYSYLYCMTVKGQDEKIKNYLDNSGENFSKRINDIIKGYSAISGSRENSQNELSKVAELIISGAYKDAKSSAMIPLIRIMAGSNLRNENRDEDKILKGLNVAGGIKGLDFSESNILEDDKNIEIIVRYKIKPSFMLPEICVIQRSVAKAWMEGEMGSDLGGSSTGIGNVWDMEQKNRGREIQIREGKNLPEFFPVIAIFTKGKAVAVKSVDVEAVTYKKQENLEAKILGFIEELAEFNDGTYMEKKITIKTKELIIVVPEGTIKDEVKSTFEKCKTIAIGCGINLIIKDCYGKKSIAEKDKENKEDVMKDK